MGIERKHETLHTGGVILQKGSMSMSSTSQQCYYSTPLLSSGPLYYTLYILYITLQSRGAAENGPCCAEHQALCVSTGNSEIPVVPLAKAWKMKQDQKGVGNAWL